MWPWVLSFCGLLALWLLGNKSTWGSIVGLLSDVLWGIYSWESHQWGFILSCLVYAGFHLRNLVKWKREANGQAKMSKMRDDHLPYERMPEEG